jgi:hypothetical protein
MEVECGILNKIEIEYEVENLAERTQLVRSPNLDISVGLTISILLGPNVFSIENHKTAGKILLDWGAVAIDGEWVDTKELGDTSFLYPIKLYKGVISAELG